MKHKKISFSEEVDNISSVTKEFERHFAVTFWLKFYYCVTNVIVEAG